MKKGKGQTMKKILWIPIILLFIVIFVLSEFQTTPTLKELKALRSIRGQIAGSIVWSTIRHGPAEIYKMNADGTNQVRLTNDQNNNFHPVWSKDGKWIYYERDEDIYRMLPDGSNPQMVVTNGFAFDVTDDGTGLIYVRKEQNRDSIVLLDLEKGTKEEIIPARVPEFNGRELDYPTISPDGKWLAFASDYPNAWTIHIVALDGNNRYIFGNGCMPQYRPDGLLLTWITSGVHEVHMATPDGKNKRPFENSISGRPHCYFSRWSNDGEYILFAASPLFDWSSDYEIYIKPSSGGEAVRLTFHPAADIWPDLFIPQEK